MNGREVRRCKIAPHSGMNTHSCRLSPSVAKDRTSLTNLLQGAHLEHAYLLAEYQRERHRVRVRHKDAACPTFPTYVARRHPTSTGKTLRTHEHGACVSKHPRLDVDDGDA